MSKIIKIQEGAAPNGIKQGGGSMFSSVAEEETFRPLEDLWQGAYGDSPQIRSSRSQAEEIINNAKEAAVQIEQDAYQKGYAQGEKDGLAQGEKKFGEAIRNTEELLKKLQDQIAGLHKKHGQDLLVLIKAMVGRLVNHEVSVNPGVIQACLRKTMEFVVENSVVRIHLHSDDFNRLKEAGLENLALLDGKSKVQLVEDPNISMGGCLASSDFGEVDSTLENCREKLYEAVDRAFLASLADDTSEEENAGEA